MIFKCANVRYTSSITLSSNSYIQHTSINFQALINKELQKLISNDKATELSVSEFRYLINLTTYNMFTYFTITQVQAHMVHPTNLLSLKSRQ